MLDLITDRTPADVALWRAGEADAKGEYKYTDLNRVGAALREVSAQLAAVGIRAPVTARTNWARGSYPTLSDMNAYLADVVTIRQAITQLDTTPQAPARIAVSSPGRADGLDYAGANAIEQILLDVEDALIRMREAFVYSGEFAAGEA